MAWITRTSYTGDGATTIFTIGFPYIAGSDVKVYFGTTLQSNATYTFPTPTQIQFTVAPPGATAITFQRSTDITIVNLLAFGSTPSTASLNSILQRVQYIVQESSDAILQGTMTLLATGQWNANTRQISNIVDGTLNNDAVTVEQLALKQPLNTLLTSITNLSTGANFMPYFTGTNTAAQTALTSLARTLLGNSTTSAMQSTLGLGSLAPLNTVNNSNWSGTALSISNGGTGQTTASAGFNALSPMTTLGDLTYGGTAGAGTQLPGNTTSTKKFLRQTGTGSVSAAPAWDTVTQTDVGLGSVENTALSTWAGSSNVTTLGTVTTGAWGATAIPVNKGGTGQTTANAGFNALSPLTTSGDVLYGGASGAGTRLAANATATKKYLQSVSSGVPSWAQTDFADLSGNIATNQINSGTSASSTTFHRGDNTWAAAVTSVGTSGLATGGTITGTGTIGVTAATVSDAKTATGTTQAITPAALAGIWAKGTDIASGSTLTIPTTGGGFFVVTGTTTVTAISEATTSNGRLVRFRFAGALTLTHNATSLILPGGANITTAAGDTTEFVTEDGTNWRCVGYTRANGAGLGPWSMVSSQTVSGVASVAFTGLTGAAYMIVGTGIVPATNTVDFWSRTSSNSGSSYDSGAANYSSRQNDSASSTVGSNASDTKMILNNSAVHVANSGVTGSEGTLIAYIMNPGTTLYPRVFGSYAYMDTGGFLYRSEWDGGRLAAGAMNAIQFLFSSGNLSGTFTLYKLVSAN